MEVSPDNRYQNLYFATDSVISLVCKHISEILKFQNQLFDSHHAYTSLPKSKFGSKSRLHTSGKQSISTIAKGTPQLTGLWVPTHRAVLIKSLNLTFPWVGSSCGGLWATVANCSALSVTIKHILLSQTHKLIILLTTSFPRKTECIRTFPSLVTPMCSFRSKLGKKAIFREQINHWAKKQPARLYCPYQFSSTVRPLMNVYVLDWMHFPSAQGIMFINKALLLLLVSLSL